jgi:hypothetical protein
MPDERGNQTADEETIPKTPQHAYAEGREEDVVGDVDKLKSGDPNVSQTKEIEGDDSDFDERPKPPEKH